MAYQFLDGNGSVLTADSSIISGSGVSGTIRPIIQIGSVLSPIPTQASGNQSVSGTVGASIIGLTPVTFSGSPSISGAVTLVGNTSVSGTVGASIIGLTPVTFSGSPSISGAVTVVGNPSISGTVNIAGNPSISGTVNIAGNPSISGTINVGNAPSVYGNISGSVVAFQGGAWTPSISGTAGASIIGQLPAGTAVLGSVLNLQGTNPWIITGSVQGFPTNQNVSGSVVAFQGGTHSPSAIGYLKRNDTLASTLGADLTYGEAMRDSAGRIVVRPFAAEEARVEGYASTVNVSVTTLVAAAGAGLRNYITDLWIANTGSVATLVTFRSQGGLSVLGYTVAPANGGSNLPGLTTPIRTGANETFDIQATTAVSILFGTVKGYKGP